MTFVSRELALGKAQWRDVHGASPEELRELAKRYGIHPPMMADCLDPGHLPKLEKEGSLSFLILRGFDEKSSPDETSIQGATRKVAIFWGPGFLLTIHRDALPWLDSTFSHVQLRSNTSTPTLGWALKEIMEDCLYTYEAPIDKAALLVDKLEDDIFSAPKRRGNTFEIQESAYVAKKRAALFKRMVRLTRDIVPAISKTEEGETLDLRGLKEELDRLYIYADDLVETANDLVQLSISLTGHRTNEVVRVLTLVSIFLLPLNLIAGIYGMNFDSMPELKHPYGYPMVLGTMGAVTLGIYLFLKRRGWIR
jgi:magnesium transporter